MRLIDTLPADFVRGLLACWRGDDFDVTAFLSLLRAHGIDGLKHEAATDQMMAEVFAINHPTNPAPAPTALATICVN